MNKDMLKNLILLLGAVFLLGVCVPACAWAEEEAEETEMRQEASSGKKDKANKKRKAKGKKDSKEEADLQEDAAEERPVVRKHRGPIIKKKYKGIKPDFFCDEEDYAGPDEVKEMLRGMGLNFPGKSSATYDEETGTLTATLPAEEHKYLRELYKDYMKKNKRK